jgi:hypothetical protein
MRAEWPAVAVVLTPWEAHEDNRGSPSSSFSIGVRRPRALASQGDGGCAMSALVREAGEV